MCLFARLQRKTASFPQPLDRAALLLMFVLSLIIAVLIWGGDRTVPHVQAFSWQDREVGAEDRAFILTFSRPMNLESVEANLRISPPLRGKISWAGRRMAYTLKQPAAYGNLFEVRLAGARDRYTATRGSQPTLQPFVGRFRTRDRVFAYIGVEGESEGQLILYNLTQQQQQILTPREWVIFDFKAYPQGDRILFSAASRSAYRQGQLDTQLYTVTTGLGPSSSDPSTQPSGQPAGQIELVLDNRNYQNLKFDLSPDGQKILVQRVNRRNPSELGLWLLGPETNPQLLSRQPGGNFLITPDSEAVAVAQGQGLALLPLTPQVEETRATGLPNSSTQRGTSQSSVLAFLPKFGQVLSFARDGTLAAMVQFNPDYTRSLFLVTSQGQQQELLRTTGSVLSAHFSPTSPVLYCLLTELLPGETYQEVPYIAAIHLKTQELTPLVQLPEQRGTQISLSPDGLALLFDQTIATSAPSNPDAPLTEDGRAIASSRLWLIPLAPGNADARSSRSAQPPQPELLPLAGFQPRWLP